jgi:hypothetical protein
VGPSIRVIDMYMNVMNMKISNASLSHLIGAQSLVATYQWMGAYPTNID